MRRHRNDNDCNVNYHYDDGNDPQERDNRFWKILFWWWFIDNF